MGTACDVIRALVRKQDEGDLDGYADGFAEDGEFRHPAATVRGRAAIREFMATYAEAFPDGRHEITTMVEGDGVVAMEGTYAGTHTGPMRSPDGVIPPTGRTVELHWAGLAHMRGGLVVSLHGYYDQLAFLSQLGLVPQPQTA